MPLNTISSEETTFAGTASASVSLFGVSGFELIGDFSLSLNSGEHNVEEIFDFGGKNYNLVLPKGPYVRVSASDVNLRVGGQSIRGDFVFEKKDDGAVKALTNMRLSAMGRISSSR